MHQTYSSNLEYILGINLEFFSEKFSEYKEIMKVNNLIILGTLYKNPKMANNYVIKRLMYHETHPEPFLDQKLLFW